jgi:hypothetical protein
MKSMLQLLSVKTPTTNIAPQGNSFHDYADLKTTFTLDRKSVVLMYYAVMQASNRFNLTAPAIRWYQVAQWTSNNYVVGRVAVDNVPVEGSQHLTGNSGYSTTGTMFVKELNAGSHTFAPQYRQPGTGSESMCRHSCLHGIDSVSLASFSYQWRHCK